MLVKNKTKYKKIIPHLPVGENKHELFEVERFILASQLVVVPHKRRRKKTQLVNYRIQQWQLVLLFWMIFLYLR